MNEVLDQLIEMEKERPNLFRSNLTVGDLVSLTLHNGSFLYEIDDLDLHTKLGEFSNDNDFYLALEEYFINGFTEKNLSELFLPQNEKNGKIIAPFSKVVERKLAKCLEKSVLVQLRKQACGSSFLVYGNLGHDKLLSTIPHAHNIVFNEDKPYLVDTQNPVIVGEERTLVPYVVPIEGITDEVIQIGEGWRNKRKYTLVPKKVQRPSLLSFLG